MSIGVGSILTAITTVLGFLRDLFAWKRSQDDRAAGRAEANESTLRQNAERVAEAQRAEAEPDVEDDGFRRD